MIYGCTVYYGSKENTVELACAMENYKTVTPKSSPDRFREVVVYTSFQKYGLEHRTKTLLNATGGLL